MDRPERTSVQPLRQLPHTVTKKQIRYMYQRIHFTTLYHEINLIMADLREKDIEDVKMRRQLRHPEWVEFIRRFGYPEGYEKSFN